MNNAEHESLVPQHCRTGKGQWAQVGAEDGVMWLSQSLLTPNLSHSSCAVCPQSPGGNLGRQNYPSLNQSR